MIRLLIGFLWLVAFCVVAAVVVGPFVPSYVPLPFVTIAHGQAVRLAGLILGSLVFFPLAGVGLLPGAGRRRGTAVEWGWKQAVWLFVQFLMMQAAAQVLFLVVLVGVRILAVRVGHVVVAPLSAGLGESDSLVFVVAAGYLAAAWWSVWYIGRLGPERLAEGGPEGIGWRPAGWQGYLAAVGCLIVVSVVGAVVEHVLPPGKGAAAGDLINQIFGSAGWKVGALFVLAAIVAPFLEEFVFRGGMLAALAPRLGVFWGALVTSLVFTAAHLEETWAYLPGLLVILAIAVMLAWLRVRYQSIRPGILLHVLFNGISVLALAFSR